MATWNGKRGSTVTTGNVKKDSNITTGNAKKGNNTLATGNANNAKKRAVVPPMTPPGPSPPDSPVERYRKPTRCKFAQWSDEELSLFDQYSFVRFTVADIHGIGRTVVVTRDFVNENVSKGIDVYAGLSVCINLLSTSVNVSLFWLFSTDLVTYQVVQIQNVLPRPYRRSWHELD